MQITVTQAPENRRRRKPDGGEKLGLGNLFSDHMFLMDYSQGTGWRDARIVPYGPLRSPPPPWCSTTAGDTSGDEGVLRADGAICLFPSRPERGAHEPVGGADVSAGDPGRRPARRPPGPGTARPGVDTEGRGGLPVHPSHDDSDRGGARRSPLGGGPFFVITGPVGAYYARGFDPVRILVEERYVRAANGGVGEAKRALEIMRPASSRRRTRRCWASTRSFSADAERRSFVEEVGTMNIFFMLRGELLTPRSPGSLPGAARVVPPTLAREWDIPAAECPAGWSSTKS